MAATPPSPQWQYLYADGQQPGCDHTRSRHRRQGGATGTGQWRQRHRAAYSGNIISTTHALGKIDISLHRHGRHGRQETAMPPPPSTATPSPTPTPPRPMSPWTRRRCRPGEAPGNTGSAFGTKTATLSGNIITGNVNNVSWPPTPIMPTAPPPSAAISSPPSPPTPATCWRKPSARSIAITGNILNLGQQEL